MRAPVLLTGLLLVAAGCPRAGGEAEDAAVAVAPVGAVDAGWALTAAHLDGWLRFQTQRLAVLSSDAGAALPVLARARLEAALAADAGLTFAEVDRVESVVGAVVTARLVDRLSGEDAAAELERAAQGLSGAQKAQVEEAAAALRERLETTDVLAAERVRFTDAGVALVLSREADVVRVWNALLEQRPAEVRIPRRVPEAAAGAAPDAGPVGVALDAGVAQAAAGSGPALDAGGAQATAEPGRAGLAPDAGGAHRNRPETRTADAGAPGLTAPSPRRTTAAPDAGTHDAGAPPPSPGSTR